MRSRKLPNYLKTHRKRVGFSQEELAFLLGFQNPAIVSRYELSVRQPSLQTALAYEAVFGTPLPELFAGVYEEIEREVAGRARELAQKIYTDKPDPATARKLEHLRLLIFGPDVLSENE